MRSNRGFTLVELMVALTLLGLIATLLASGTRIALDTSGRGNRKAEQLRTGHLERELLRSQLQGALPFRYWTQVDEKRVDHVAFEGDPDRIQFVSRIGISDGPDSLPRWVDLRRQTAANGPTKFVVEEHRILPPDNQPSQNVTANSESLNCMDLRFEYLDTTGEKPNWLSAWHGAERKSPLPSAVRIECKTAADSIKLLVPLDYAESAKQGMVLQ
jgi:general secretion pathway protein J